jgi:hypothetical protein
LFLAAGQLLGHPVIGVWLGMGLACGAGTYMLRTFVPARWAFVGGLLMASRLGMSKWGWNYWGGGVGFAAGALFIGGWARVIRKPQPVSSVVMSLGLVLLANSRPLEGLLLCIPVGLTTLVWAARYMLRARAVRLASGTGAAGKAEPDRSPQLGYLWRRVGLPALCVLAPAVAAGLYYNFRVTGNALRLPYVEYFEQNEITPPLLVQSAKSVMPEFRNKEMRESQVDYTYYSYNVQRQDRSVWIDYSLQKVATWRSFFLGYGLILPLLVLPCVLLKSPRARFALLSCVFVFGFVATVHVFGAEHYVAPAAPLLYLLVIQGFRYLSLLRLPGSALIRWCATAWLTACLLAPLPKLIPQFGDWLPEPGSPSKGETLLARCPDWLLTRMRGWLVHMPAAEWAVTRAQLEQKLKSEGGRHIVLVVYANDHSHHDEWVYNEADIATAPVIWARPIDRDGYERLARHFADRTIWLIQASATGNSLQQLRKPLAKPL